MHPTNIGRRITLASELRPAGYVVKPTQLISARVPEPLQWVITLMQPVTGGSGVNPWVSTFDGGAYPPVPPAIFTAPVLPLNTTGMQLVLRWGAGGCSFETQADYPARGGAFGVVADTLDLNVMFRGEPLPYASADLIPVVGAFMVEGQSPESAPLRWLDVPGNLTTAATATRYWAVKPYARRVRVSFTGAMAPVGTIPDLQVAFLDTNNNTLWVENYETIANQTGLNLELNIPAQATLMSLTHNGAPVIAATVEWMLGLI